MSIEYWLNWTPKSVPKRIEISRIEYENMTGQPVSEYTIGATIYTGGVPHVEYVFTDDGPTKEWLKGLYALKDNR